MLDLQLPSAGLTILHDRANSSDKISKELPHIIQLNLVENITKEILRSVKNNEQVRLKLGKKPLVQYGRKQLGLSHAADTFPAELFVGPLDGSEPVYFSGRMSHTLEVRKAKEDTARSDEALAALESSLKSMKEQQASNEVSFMIGKGDAKKKDLKSSLGTRDLLRGTTSPSSPFMGVSPRFGPTSNPLMSTGPSKDKIRQDAMRIPLVHLLAMGPMSPKSIAHKLGATQADCDRVLDKVARDGSGGNKELKEKCYRELDVYKFRYQTEEDRQAAINNAIHAYDRMRIDKNDHLWQMLLPNEERGKGKILSRLNFERPPPAAATPKLAADGEGKPEVSDKEGKTKKPKVAADVKDTQPKKKPNGDTVVRKRVERAQPKSTTPSTKAEAKFKSSERIEDSDEEVEGVEVAPPLPKVSKTTERESKVLPTQRTLPKVQANVQHKSKLSASSLSGVDAERLRPHEDRTKAKPRAKHERSPSALQISPRPRVGSSPQKPSPLASSPPTNSTDLENSSKSSAQSSAPSSPPSSTDMPLSQARKNYSPVIAGRGRNAVNPPKRKGEKGDEPPAKRQQVHGLGLSKTLTEKFQQPTPERRSSESSVSSPEKHAVTKDTVVDATIKFREYYINYKDLHAKLHRLNPDERPDRDLDRLWEMHKRLEKIKAELWSDWAKAGGELPM